MRDKSRLPDVRRSRPKCDPVTIANGQNVSTAGVDEHAIRTRPQACSAPSQRRRHARQDPANAVLGARWRNAVRSPQAALGQTVRANVAGAPLTLTDRRHGGRGSNAGSNDDDQVFLPLSRCAAVRRDPKNRRNVQQILRSRRAARGVESQGSPGAAMLERRLPRGLQRQVRTPLHRDQVTQTLTILLGDRRHSSWSAVSDRTYLLAPVAERTRETDLAVGANAAILRSCRRVAGGDNAGGRWGVSGGVAAGPATGSWQRRPGADGGRAAEHLRGLWRLGAGRAVLRHLPGTWPLRSTQSWP